jgi:hypothetical protein
MSLMVEENATNGTATPSPFNASGLVGQSRKTKTLECAKSLCLCS